MKGHYHEGMWCAYKIKPLLVKNGNLVWTNNSVKQK